jgi:hypothetical protein
MDGYGLFFWLDLVAASALFFLGPMRHVKALVKQSGPNNCVQPQGGCKQSHHAWESTPRQV